MLAAMLFVIPLTMRQPGTINVPYLFACLAYSLLIITLLL